MRDGMRARAGSVRRGGASRMALSARYLALGIALIGLSLARPPAAQALDLLEHDKLEQTCKDDPSAEDWKQRCWAFYKAKEKCQVGIIAGVLRPGSPYAACLDAEYRRRLPMVAERKAEEAEKDAKRAEAARRDEALLRLVLGKYAFSYSVEDRKGVQNVSGTLLIQTTMAACSTADEVVRCGNAGQMDVRKGADQMIAPIHTRVSSDRSGRVALTVGVNAGPVRGKKIKTSQFDCSFTRIKDIQCSTYVGYNNKVPFKLVKSS